MNNESTIISNHPVPQNFWPEPITEDHYVLGDGNLSAQVLMKDGHGWKPFLPIGEAQYKNNLETSCCPAYGTLNAVEAIGRFKYGVFFQSDLSDRYLSITSGMNGNGGYPHVIAETMRTWAGAIPEVFLPFDKTITTLDKFFTPRPVSYSLFKYGYNWLQKYAFGHQWLFLDGSLAYKQAAVKKGLQFSPVGVAGYAWSRHSDGKYYNDGPAIHWFIVFDYEFYGDLNDPNHPGNNDPRNCWYAFDTYPDENGSYIKKLDWNYNFAYAKGYTLNKKLGATDSANTPNLPCVIPYLTYRIKFLFKMQ